MFFAPTITTIYTLPLAYWLMFVAHVRTKSIPGLCLIFTLSTLVYRNILHMFCFNMISNIGWLRSESTDIALVENINMGYKRTPWAAEFLTEWTVVPSMFEVNSLHMIKQFGRLCKLKSTVIALPLTGWLNFNSWLPIIRQKTAV